MICFLLSSRVTFFFFLGKLIFVPEVEFLSRLILPIVWWLCRAWDVDDLCIVCRPVFFIGFLDFNFWFVYFSSLVFFALFVTTDLNFFLIDIIDPSLPCEVSLRGLALAVIDPKLFSPDILTSVSRHWGLSSPRLLSDWHSGPLISARESDGVWVPDSFPSVLYLLCRDRLCFLRVFFSSICFSR